jgi:hypothetical protein
MRPAAIVVVESGCSSGVERNLAKVDVVSSNLITRSIFSLRSPAGVIPREDFGAPVPLVEVRRRGLP